MPERSTHCHVCKNARCLQIEAALAQGVSFASISRKFKITRYSLRRHLRHQLKDATPTTTAQSLEEVEHDEVLTKCHRIQVGLDAIQREFERCGDSRGKLNVLKVKSQVLDLETKIRYRPEPVTNIALFPGAIPAGHSLAGYLFTKYQDLEKKLCDPVLERQNHHSYLRGLLNLGVEPELAEKVLALFGYKPPTAPLVFPAPAALPAAEEGITIDG